MLTHVNQTHVRYIHIYIYIIYIYTYFERRLFEHMLPLTFSFGASKSLSRRFIFFQDVNASLFGRLIERKLGGDGSVF